LASSVNPDGFSKFVESTGKQASQSAELQKTIEEARAIPVKAQADTITAEAAQQKADTESKYAKIYADARATEARASMVNAETNRIKARLEADPNSPQAALDRARLEKLQLENQENQAKAGSSQRIAAQQMVNATNLLKFSQENGGFDAIGNSVGYIDNMFPTTSNKTDQAEMMLQNIKSGEFAIMSMAFKLPGSQTEAEGQKMQSLRAALDQAKTPESVIKAVRGIAEQEAKTGKRLIKEGFVKPGTQAFDLVVQGIGQWEDYLAQEKQKRSRFKQSPVFDQAQQNTPIKAQQQTGARGANTSAPPLQLPEGFVVRQIKRAE
jgi:hypothetical protein